MISKETLKEIRDYHKNNVGKFSVSILKGKNRHFLISTDCIKEANKIFRSVPEYTDGVVLFGC